MLNAHGDIFDLDEKHDDVPVNLAMLSLASERVFAGNENRPPPAARKKRGKYTRRTARLRSRRLST